MVHEGIGVCSQGLYEYVHKCFTRVIGSRAFHDGYKSVFTRVIGLRVFHKGYRSVFTRIYRSVS